jgi:hypothetical protein
MMATTVAADRVATASRVSQVGLPADARALSTLARIDYADAFIVDAGVEHTAEQWARVVLQDPPLDVRTRLVLGWTALGLRLGPPWWAHRVLGWKVRQSRPDVLLLAAGSWLGIQGELLFRSEPHGLLFATFVQLNNVAARRVWAMVTPKHQLVVRSLLAHAARRATQRCESR